MPKIKNGEPSTLSPFIVSALLAATLTACGGSSGGGTNSSSSSAPSSSSSQESSASSETSSTEDSNASNDGASSENAAESSTSHESSSAGESSASGDNSDSGDSSASSSEESTVPGGNSSSEDSSASSSGVSDSSSSFSSSSSASESSASESSASSSSESSSSENNADAPFAIDPDFQLYTLADFPVGVAVSAAGENYSIFNHSDATERQNVITEHFNQLTAGNIMKMSYLHDDAGEFTFGNADELVGFADTHGMTVHGHALFWHPDYQVPNWATAARDSGASASEWRTLFNNHVSGVVEHFDTEFPGTVVSWDVVNEAVSDSPDQGDGWRQSIFYDALPPATDGDIPEYIRVAFQAARDTGTDIDLYYNDYDNTANTARLNKTLEIADGLAEDSLIDGVGFQMHVYMTYPSLDAFENAFQEVVDRGLKVKVTELDIAVVNPYGGNAPDELEYDADLAGEQKQRFCDIARVYLETVPADLRGGFTVWGLTDDESWLMQQFRNAAGADYEDVWPLLFNADLSAKPALQGVADAFQGNACNSEI